MPTLFFYIIVDFVMLLYCEYEYNPKNNKIGGQTDMHEQRNEVGMQTVSDDNDDERQDARN